jgi:glutamate-1-semialdehyde 2,1-aminomutase
MDLLAPAGPVYQAGTLSGNPTATAAGVATLERCTPEVYRALDAHAVRVGSIVSAALSDAGVAHRLQYAGSLFSVFFRAHAVVDYETARAQDTAAYATFFHAMLDHGVWLPPSAFEAWFVSAALDEDDFDRIDAGARAAAAALA